MAFSLDTVGLGALREALWVALGVLRVVLEAVLAGFVAIVCAANIGASDGNYKLTTWGLNRC